MASGEVSILARLRDDGVVSGVRKIKASLKELKGEDGKLSWKGIAKGGEAPRRSARASPRPAPR